MQIEVYLRGTKVCKKLSIKVNAWQLPIVKSFAKIIKKYNKHLIISLALYTISRKMNYPRTVYYFAFLRFIDISIDSSMEE